MARIVNSGHGVMDVGSKNWATLRVYREMRFTARPHSMISTRTMHQHATPPVPPSPYTTPGRQ
jgi:hypothetical protein